MWEQKWFSKIKIVLNHTLCGKGIRAQFRFVQFSVSIFGQFSVQGRVVHFVGFFSHFSCRVGEDEHLRTLRGRPNDVLIMISLEESEGQFSVPFGQASVQGSAG